MQKLLFQIKLFKSDKLIIESNKWYLTQMKKKMFQIILFE